MNMYTSYIHTIITSPNTYIYNIIIITKQVTNTNATTIITTSASTVNYEYNTSYHTQSEERGRERERDQPPKINQ